MNILINIHDWTKVIDEFRYSKMNFYKNEFAKYYSTKLTQDFMVYPDVDNIHQYVSNQKPFGLTNAVELNDEELIISTEIWKKHLFDKVMDPMIEHIEDLLNNKLKDIKYICICGGLSISKYFQSRMRDTFGINSKYKLSIRIPSKPILSVIDGAVKLATKPNYICGRKVKYSYGIAVDRGLDKIDSSKLPKDYLNTHTFTDTKTGTKTVSGLFSAFILKNDLQKLVNQLRKNIKGLIYIKERN